MPCKQRDPAAERAIAAARCRVQTKEIRIQSERLAHHTRDPRAGPIHGIVHPVRPVPSNLCVHGARTTKPDAFVERAQTSTRNRARSRWAEPGHADADADAESAGVHQYSRTSGRGTNATNEHRELREREHGVADHAKTSHDSIVDLVAKNLRSG